MITEYERQLIEALQQDDQSAIKTIFLTYHAGLCRVAFKIVNDADVARDMVQDVYLKLWQTRRKLNVQVSLEFYLKRAVVNTSLNYLERSKKFIPFEPAERQSGALAQNVVEQAHNATELSVRIERAVNELPPRTKVVFTLIRFEEMSYREVAESLGISEKAVEKEMMKALSNLRQALQDYLPLLFMVILS